MKTKTFPFLIWLILVLLSITACTPSTGATDVGMTAEPDDAGEDRRLTVMTHDSFSVSEEVLNSFIDDNGFEVVFLKSGDTGTAVNKAVLAKDQPLADIFYGIDNTFLSRGLEEGIFEPYESPILSDIPDDFKLDPQNRALPVDFGDVCLNYDKAYFEKADIQPPGSLEDLTKPELRGLLVVENPATSSPGLAFLLATIGHFGEENYLDYWQSLVENDVLVVNDWEIAYRQEFSFSGGERPIVVSYGSSPPFEVFYSEQSIDEPTTTAVVSDESCFRQIEFVGILSGTPHRDMAEEWIDFMLSPAFQEDIPLQMFVFPVNRNAEIGETFERFLLVADNPAFVRPDLIAENRENWIQAWTETVLR